MKLQSRIKQALTKTHTSIRGMCENETEYKKVQRQIVGMHGLTAETIELIAKSVPNLSMEWLLREEGKMLNNDNKPYIPMLGDKGYKPRIPLEALAGSLQDISKGVLPIQCTLVPVVYTIPAYDFTIIIKGDSMSPEYMSGDEVACLKITDSSFLQWGRVHVLDTRQGCVIKRIYNNGDKITCKSYNPEYPDFDIPKDEIFSINLVVGVVRLT